MKHKLYPTIIGLVYLLSLLLCGCNEDILDPPIRQPHVDFFYYDAENQLINSHENIIWGRVEKVERFVDVVSVDSSKSKAKQLATLAYIRVERTLKGDLPEGKTIIQYLPGDGEDYIYSHIENSGGYYAEGDAVLLFLYEPTEEWITYYKKNNRKQYRKDKTIPYQQPHAQGRYWLDEEGNILHDRNPFEYTLFTDCATVDELVEKYGLS